MEQSFLSSPYIYLILAWVLPWKGVALWKAANNRHKWWFIALLVFNTLAILEIIYIFYFSEKSKGENSKFETNSQI